MKRCALELAGLAAIALASIAEPAGAGTLGVAYYTVAETGDPDFSTSCCFVVTALVQPRLGPHGLPVLNPIFAERNNAPTSSTM